MSNRCARYLFRESRWTIVFALFLFALFFAGTNASASELSSLYGSVFWEGAGQASDVLRPLGADLIAWDSEKTHYAFSIDKGTADGIGVGMTVVEPNGLVGRISEVQEHTAQVHTVIDPQNSEPCSVFVDRTRDTAVLSSVIEEEQETFYLLYPSSSYEANPGDVMFSAGIDPLYPRGLKVGSVVENDVVGESKDTIVVKLSADLAALQQVWVLLGSVK